MSWVLIVAEKPSVAKDIANVVKATEKKEGYFQGNGYRVTWCLGHLIEYCTPEKYSEEYKKWSFSTLPIIPDTFKTDVIEKVKSQFHNVKKLMNDESVTEIICGTDAGREGELIFRLTYNQAGCRKPFKRLWISSMTDEAIRNGMENLKEGREYYNLYESARCRAEADWLIGINATRLFTVKYGHKLTVGRVQTPTLALLVNRHNEIINFKPEPYYQLKADFGTFKALWYDKKTDKSRIQNKADAEVIKKQCQGEAGTVVRLETKAKSTERPLLFDLTELQREGNRRYGFTAQQVLTIAQSLYETHKITTYPRTDSRYITDDMIPTLQPILESIKKNDTFNVSGQIDSLIARGLNIDSRIVDNSKVSDHHSIIPNKNICSYDLSKLNSNEQKILKLIIARFIVTLSDKHTYDETTLMIDVNGELFKASGKRITNAGWKAVEDSILGKSEEEKESEDLGGQVFPDVKQGQEYRAQAVELMTKKTQPKKPFTEATLLTAMENASDTVEDDSLKEHMKERGLGTPATRAGIIEKLIQVGYIERKGKKIEPTETGIKFIELMPDKLKQADLTAEWEHRLNLMTNGKEQSNKFINDIKAYVKSLVGEYKGEVSKETFKAEKEVIGLCPRCEKNIYEGEKNFYCEGYKDDPKCSFTLWKQDKFFADRGKTITVATAKKLLKNGRVEMKKLKSKQGKEYDAAFIMVDTGKYINFKMEFLNSKK